MNDSHRYTIADFFLRCASPHLSMFFSWFDLGVRGVIQVQKLTQGFWLGFQNMAQALCQQGLKKGHKPYGHTLLINHLSGKLMHVSSPRLQFYVSPSNQLSVRLQLAFELLQVRNGNSIARVFCSHSLWINMNRQGFPARIGYSIF